MKKVSHFAFSAPQCRWESIFQPPPTRDSFWGNFSHRSIKEIRNEKASKRWWWWPTFLTLIQQHSFGMGRLKNLINLIRPETRSAYSQRETFFWWCSAPEGNCWGREKMCRLSRFHFLSHVCLRDGMSWCVFCCFLYFDCFLGNYRKTRTCCNSHLITI